MTRGNLVDRVTREHSMHSRDGRRQPYHERLSAISNEYKESIKKLMEYDTDESKALADKIKPSFDLANDWIRSGKDPADFDPMQLANLESERPSLRSQTGNILKKKKEDKE